MRDQHLTLMHAIPPLRVSWPVAYMETSFAEWQEANAREVIEKAQKTVQTTAGESPAPMIDTEVRHIGSASAP